MLALDAPRALLECLDALAPGTTVWLAVMDPGAAPVPRVSGFTGLVPTGSAGCATGPPPVDPPPIDPPPVEPPPVEPPPVEPPPIEPPPVEPDPAGVCITGTFAFGTPPGGRIGPGITDYGARAVQLTG